MWDDANSVPVQMRARLAAGAEELSPDDLARINASARRELDPRDLFAFACTMATRDLTDYGTHMGASSLVNFAADAERGVPYTVDHRRDLTYGYTYAGRTTPEVSGARAGVYLLRDRWPAGRDGRSTNQEIADIQDGLRREVSVWFYGLNTRFICDLCGQNVFGTDCPHLPGFRREGVLATATVEDARLGHVSGVDRGACPGALIDKAAHIYRARQMSAPE